VIAFLQRCLPQRIASQIALLVVTALVLAHLVVSLTFIFLNPRPGFSEGPGAVVTRLVFAARLIDSAASPQARADIVRAAEASIRNLSFREQPVLEPRLPDRPPIREIQASLGDRFDVFAVRPEGSPDQAPHIAITLPSGGTLMAPFVLTHWPRGPSPALIGTLAFLASAIALLSLWATKTLTAPLTRFADAAERFTVGRSEAPLPERGPREIVRAAKAFNDMRERVRRLVDDRARTLAAISHDLRTPITRLRLRAEEIEPEPLRQQVVQDLDTMKDMVQSALTFLRDQATPTCRVVIDLPTLLQTVCDGFGDLGRTVDFSGPPHLYVEGDPDQLGRAIANVIENGLKFAASVTVSLTTSSGNMACIEIQDDGPGIPDVEKRNVLEPFYRGDSARGLDGQHSFGLGLSITRAIVEAHDATLELHDVQPHGLLVRLILPKAAADSLRRPATPEPAAPAVSSTAS
jgi:signal transduction histidine kinase